MSVLSLKTAVTCEKPLRENERVYSSRDAGERVLDRNVTCFSISTGERAGAMVLICTWLLVMSGTASIGSLVIDQTPSAQATAVNSTMNQRLRIERSRIFSIITRPPLLFRDRTSGQMC